MSRPSELSAALQDARNRLEGLRYYDPALAACVAGLARLQAMLSRPPRVVILGEVNAGKTSIADLLLGIGLLPSSVVANTRLPVLIRYADETTIHAIGGDGRRILIESADTLPDGMDVSSLDIGLPNERLRDFEIVDTPALSGESASIAADIRIWCTVATRAWTESERAVWSALPRRNWHNALLVATHKDALGDPGDAAKVYRRLRAAAGKMFREVLLVAAEAGRSLHDDGRPTDASAALLVGQIRVWAEEIRLRRERKAEKIVRRLARLTLHHLARGTLRTMQARLLKEWEADCTTMLGSMGDTPHDLVVVVENLLRRFARSLELVRPGSIERRVISFSKSHDGQAYVPRAGFPSRRFARLAASDLTALLRFEVARSGLRDPDMFKDFAAARAVLLPLARLDEELTTLERVLARGRKYVAMTAAAEMERGLSLNVGR